ncbi:hypothetical protein ACIQC7_28070 [Kitasatospora sp. NPDC088556]|uniref:hypothetical protein n=1 Tax=Kitasatospora sp. NPDC088556 TaxID=3364076 RepID=UPI00382AC8BB
MNPPDPFLTSLYDQIEASSAHGSALLAADGRQVRGPITMAEAEPWTVDLIAAMSRHRRDGTLRCCVHVTGIQPAAILAEQPDVILCWECYRASTATRVCLSCGRFAGSASRFGGVEESVRGIGLLYSRMLCMPCVRPASPGGTFGSG